MTLYEITEDYRKLLSMLEDADIDEDAFLDTLEGIEGELEVKAEGYVKVINMIEADVKAYKEEAERLMKKASSAQAKTDALKKALLNAMIVTEKKEIKAGLYKLKVSNNGGLKPLFIDGTVPDEYIKMVPQNDNKAIREYLESLDGTDVECSWAHLGDRGKHLSIK